MSVLDRHLARCDVICRPSNGVQSLREVSAIPDGYQKNRSQITRLSINRAYEFDRQGLMSFDHRPGIGTYGSGSIRTKSFISPTELGRRYVELCKEAARQSNLSWPDDPYAPGYYLLWQEEWIERRSAFDRALRGLLP